MCLYTYMYIHLFSLKKIYWELSRIVCIYIYTNIYKHNPPDNAILRHAGWAWASQLHVLVGRAERGAAQNVGGSRGLWILI